MKKLIIFDLDGTLVNSLADLADATNYALHSFGYETHELNKYRYFVGDGTLLLIERALPQEKRTPEIIQMVHKVFSEEYRKCCLNKTKPYDKVVEMLKYLKSKGLLLAVASNKPDNFTKEIVHSIFGSEMFDFIHGKRDKVPKKPDPSIAFRIMNEAGAFAEETVFVGDTNIDIKTGKACGAFTIGCLWGFRDFSELKEANADKIVSSADEICDVIEKINYSEGMVLYEL